MNKETQELADDTGYPSLQYVTDTFCYNSAHLFASRELSSAYCNHHRLLGGHRYLVEPPGITFLILVNTVSESESFRKHQAWAKKRSSFPEMETGSKQYDV